jgi:hypothetical protein
MPYLRRTGETRPRPGDADRHRSSTFAQQRSHERPKRAIMKGVLLLHRGAGARERRCRARKPVRIRGTITSLDGDALVRPARKDLRSIAPEFPGIRGQSGYLADFQPRLCRPTGERTQTAFWSPAKCTGCRPAAGSQAVGRRRAAPPGERQVAFGRQVGRGQRAHARPPKGQILQKTWPDVAPIVDFVQVTGRCWCRCDHLRHSAGRRCKIMTGGVAVSKTVSRHRKPAGEAAVASPRSGARHGKVRHLRQRGVHALLVGRKRVLS